MDITNDEAKTAIGVALVYLMRYRDRRIDDLHIHSSVRTEAAIFNAGRAREDVKELDVLISKLSKTQVAPPSATK